MKISFYLLFALLVPAAQAQQLAPDVLVKSITEEVVAILKKDKDIQAGDSKKAADLIETKIQLPRPADRLQAFARQAGG